MLLRRVMEHVKTQNWMAVAIDFVIVVVGVFIGIQVANWNESRAFDVKEQELLLELRREIEFAIETTKKWQEGYGDVKRAAGRSLAFLDANESCTDNCWTVLVDFYHASQWIPVAVGRSTYDELRRLGLPRSREIVDLVESYLAQNHTSAVVFTDSPEYRTLVRSLVPTAVHDIYWATCYELIDGLDVYKDDCPAGVSDELASQTVQRITRHPDIQTTLAFWYSEITPTVGALGDQNDAAARAIIAIDQVLETKNTHEEQE
ncbi:MAG: hypothetical protein AAF438_20155 [Pseudomonadota bacterium]